MDLKNNFFWISNLGGGGSDKYRETVYLDLYINLPTLYNYYYLAYPKFANKWISNMYNYDSFSEFLKYVRESMINDEHFICDEHIRKEYNYNNIYLLDSGARNIYNDIIRKKIKSCLTIEESMIEQMKKYYDFANRFKFTYVIGFDLGGKYTFKDNEKSDFRLKQNSIDIDEDKLNNILLLETIKYIKNKKEFLPKIYATVHGNNPKEYENSIKYITKIEKELDFEFYGYALGGIASSKNVSKEWFDDTTKKDSLNTVLVTKALKIVKKYSKEKPIHVLGGGNKDNIPSLILNGATSFDCQTPGRRAYDGNEDSTLEIFDSNSKESFSKYLPALLNSKYDILNEDFNYKKLNLVDNNVLLCDCPSCRTIESMQDIKKLYSQKNKSNEYYYYSRQLMNSHAIWQHHFLTELISKYSCFEDLIKDYPISYFKNMKDFI